MKSICRVVYVVVMFCALMVTGCASFDAISTLNKTDGVWQNKVLVKGSQDYNDYLSQYKVLSSSAVEAVQKFSEPDYIYADDISRSYFAWKESKRMMKVGWSERKEMQGYIPQIEYFVKNGKQMTHEELQKVVGEIAAKQPKVYPNTDAGRQRMIVDKIGAKVNAYNVAWRTCKDSGAYDYLMANAESRYNAVTCTSNEVDPKAKEILDAYRNNYNGSIVKLEAYLHVIEKTQENEYQLAQFIKSRPGVNWFPSQIENMKNTVAEMPTLEAKLDAVIASMNEMRTYKERKVADGIARKEHILNNKFPMSDKFPKHYQFCANIVSGLSYDYVMEILNGKMKTDMPREVWDRMEEYKKQGISVIRTTSNGADVDLLFKDKVLYAARIEFENPVGLPLVIEKYRKQFGITESLKKHSDSNPVADIDNASDAFTLFRKTRAYTLSNSDIAVETAYFIFGGLVGYDENRLTAMSAFGSDVEKVKFMGDLMKLTPDGKADLIVDADFKIIRQTGIGKTLFDTIQQQGLFEKLKTHKAEVDAETAPVSYVLITDKKLLEYLNGIEKIKAEQEAIEKAKEAKAKEKAALDF